MNVNISFVVGLYLLGLFPLWYIRNETVQTFVGVTAFAWGALVWVIATVICLIAPVNFTLMNILLVIIAGNAFFAWRHYSRLRWPGRSTWRRVALPAAFFVLFVVAGESVDRAILTPDSIMQLLVANSLAALPQPAEHLYGEFGYWGPALISLQAPAVWLGRDYFDSLQPAFVATLLGAFYTIVWASLAANGMSARQSKALSLVATLLLLSTPIVLLYAFYPHNNIIVAMYLLIGTGAFWLALKLRHIGLFYLGLMGFLGVSLSRTETSLFVTLFLAAMVSLGAYSRREWLRGIIPYAGLLLGWNLWLLIRVAPQTHIMTPERLMILIAVLCGMVALIALLSVQVVRDYLAPKLHYCLLGALVMGLAFVMVLDAGHLSKMLYVFGYNLFGPGVQWWGGTWWLLVAGGLLLPRKVKTPYERLFVVGIAGFFLLLLLVSYYHPFRLGLGDSGNRAILHILPVVVYFLTLKTGAAMQAAGSGAS